MKVFWFVTTSYSASSRAFAGRNAGVPKKVRANSAVICSLVSDPLRCGARRPKATFSLQFDLLIPNLSPSAKGLKCRRKWVFAKFGAVAKRQVFLIKSKGVAILFPEPVMDGLPGL